MTEGNYSHSQTCTWCSRSEHFPDHHTLTAPQNSSEVQSHLKFMFRFSEGDEVKPCARTLKKNKPQPQHLLIRPKPEQVWDFSFSMNINLLLAPSCPPLAPPQQSFISCPLKLLHLRLSSIPAGSTIMSNPLCLESNTQHTGGLYNMQMIVTLTGVLQLGRNGNAAASRRAYTGSTVTTAQS